jgi:hypothetical protein
MTWATCPQVVKYTFGPPATMAIFICDFGVILPAAVLLDVLALALALDVLALEVLALVVPPPAELPLLQAATPKTAIAASGARYLKRRRLPVVLR